MLAIKVCSLEYADMLLATGDYSALVSIGHPACHEFCDGEIPGQTLRLGIWDKTPWRGRRERPLATGNQIQDLIDFAAGIPQDARVLVHCKKGRSRSTAAALIIHVARGERPETAIAELLRGAPKSNPNGWMLKLADAILDTRIFHAAMHAEIVKWR